MNNTNYPINKRLAVIGAVLLLLIIIIVSFNRGNGAIDPSKDTLSEDVNAGIKYALVYKQGGLYENIKNDDKNLRLIKNDLAFFARTTLPKLSDKSTLVGFTFDNDFTVDQKTYNHSGYYYGVEDKIKVSFTVQETGIITLSITNTKDGTNIDEYLNLNGPKNRLLISLPIEADFYSLRYSKSEDKVVAAFYRGYTTSDVDKVLKILKDAYGESYDEDDIIFNINAVGIFSVDEVRDYSTSQENKY